MNNNKTYTEWFQEKKELIQLLKLLFPGNSNIALAETSFNFCNTEENIRLSEHIRLALEKKMKREIPAHICDLLFLILPSTVGGIENIVKWAEAEETPDIQEVEHTYNARMPKLLCAFLANIQRMINKE